MCDAIIDNSSNLGMVCHGMSGLTLFQLLFYPLARLII